MQLIAIIVATLIPVISAQNDPAHHMAMVNACIAEEMPPSSDIELLRRQELPITHPGKCFVGCMFEKAGFFKNGVYQQKYTLDMCKKMLANNPEVLKMVLAAHEICDKEDIDSVITDKCQTGMKMMSCLHKNMPRISVSAMPD